MWNLNTLSEKISTKCLASDPSPNYQSQTGLTNPVPFHFLFISHSAMRHWLRKKKVYKRDYYLLPPLINLRIIDSQTTHYEVGIFSYRICSSKMDDFIKIKLEKDSLAPPCDVFWNNYLKSQLSFSRILLNLPTHSKLLTVQPTYFYLFYLLNTSLVLKKNKDF